MTTTDKTFLVAHYLLKKGSTLNEPLTNKKLQKLLYYSQAWHLVFFNGKPLFNDNIEAWVHGPAIPKIYRHYSSFGYEPISVEINSSEFTKLSEEEKKLMEDVWGAYGAYDADYLEALTHREQPWLLARRDLQPYQSSNAVISLKSMQSYYDSRLKASSATS